MNTTYSFEKSSEIKQIFVEEARNRILTILLNVDSICTEDLAQILDYHKQKVSRHLTFMRKMGILNSRKINQFKFYSLKQEYRSLVENELSVISVSERQQLLEKVKEFRPRVENDIVK